MFVKWTVRTKTRSRDNLGDSLVARLVESRRPGPGLNPKQVQVAYLGAIRTAMYPNHCIVFWENVLWRLDQLVLEQGERDKIEAAIAARVPRITREDWRRG